MKDLNALAGQSEPCSKECEQLLLVESKLCLMAIGDTETAVQQPQDLSSTNIKDEFGSIPSLLPPRPPPQSPGQFSAL